MTVCLNKCADAKTDKTAAENTMVAAIVKRHNYKKATNAIKNAIMRLYKEHTAEQAEKQKKKQEKSDKKKSAK